MIVLASDKGMTKRTASAPFGTFYRQKVSQLMVTKRAVVTKRAATHPLTETEAGQPHVAI